jgi:ABC-type uncharacterized transport system substrate-binding protein
MKIGIRKNIFTIVLFSCIGAPILPAQTVAGYSQQLFALTKLMPSAKAVGIISNTATESFIQSMSRTGHSFGVKVIIAKANNPREIPELYQTLLKNNVRLIWLPDKDDVMLLEKGFEFLREKTLEDKVGLCVPVSRLVSEGALCCVQTDGTKLLVTVNKRVAQVVGVTAQDDANDSIKYSVK